MGPDSVGPFVLVDISTEPFQLYLYRLVAENSAGVSIGPASNFTTPQAGECVSVGVGAWPWVHE